MRVTLDSKPCEITDAADTVGAAIAEVAGRMESEGRLIVSVEVDGRPMSDEELADAARLSAPAEAVCLESADHRELVGQALDDAIDALDEVAVIHRSAAELLQVGDEAPARVKLVEAVETWMLIQRTVATAAASLELDLEAIRVGETPVTACIDELETRLRTLRDAFQADDPVGVADTLLYELPDTTDTWRDVLAAIATAARTVPGSPAG